MLAVNGASQCHELYFYVVRHSKVCNMLRSIGLTSSTESTWISIESTFAVLVRWYSWCSTIQHEVLFTDIAHCNVCKLSRCSGLSRFTESTTITIQSTLEVSGHCYPWCCTGSTKSGRFWRYLGTSEIQKFEISVSLESDYATYKIFVFFKVEKDPLINYIDL